jgi:hypothetical protein
MHTFKYANRCGASILAVGCLFSGLLYAEEGSTSSPLKGVISAKEFDELTLQFSKWAKSWDAADAEYMQHVSMLLHHVCRKVIRNRAAESQQNRLNEARLLLKALVAIDAGIDSHFDIANPPSMNIMPPITSNALEAGISPKSIRNPRVRALYEEALRQNAERIRRYDNCEMRRQ